MRLAADAGLLVAAKGRVRRQLVIRVDPHAARLDAAGDTEGAVDVTGPDSTAKTVFRVIGELENLSFVLELDHAGNRPEDFLLADIHLIFAVNEQRRLHESTLFTAGNDGAFTAREHLGTFLLGFFDPAENLLELTLVNLRTHLSVFAKRVADLYLLKGLSQFGDEFVVDPFLHEDARARAANLPLIEENADLSAFNGLVLLAVIKVDVGGFAAEFQRSRNEALGSGFGHVVTDFGRTRKGKLRKARMIKHGLTGLRTASANDVDDAGRQELIEDFAEHIE